MHRFPAYRLLSSSLSRSYLRSPQLRLRQLRWHQTGAAKKPQAILPTGYIWAAVGGAVATYVSIAFSTPSDTTLKTQKTAPRYADKVTMLKAARMIQDIVGEDNVSFDEEDIERHGYSEWSTSNTTARPVAVISPRSTEDVSAIARICNELKVPMVPFGAGSSVEGNFSSPLSGICIDLSQMNKIVAFREDDLDITVQAGVNWVSMNEEIKSSGLFLPLDPSPTALIGGMISTNCSGTNAMRYGTMKDWVLNLTVVLADGTVIKTKERPRKSSAGYNLNSLFTGSEGTLGIITEATLKLAVLPESFSVATATFDSIEKLAQAATKMVRSGIPLAALEMMDTVQMNVINRNGGAGGKMWKELPTLFIKFSGTPGSIKDNALRIRKMVNENGGGNFLLSSSQQEMDNLWAARKEALWAMLAVREPGTEIWSTDVAVPMSRLAEIIDISKRESSKLGLFSTVLGHVGDGNFHQAVMYNPSVPEQKNAVQKCVDDMVKRAIEMEGTVSGEHGIGLGKKHCLEKELMPETLNVMRSLKKTLDPKYADPVVFLGSYQWTNAVSSWVLNPGKLFDEP